MITLQVNTKSRDYPVYIGENLFNNCSFLNSHIIGKHVVIITNITVAPLYLEKLKKNISPQKKIFEIILDDGEKWKNITTLSFIFDEMMKMHCDKETTIIALGGGVVGDMAGFAASCYKRGVNYIQIPTTLLSQVDSSVGGKTGINHPQGKNMIGSFYQPSSVFTDLSFLQTLPSRAFNAGIAEIIKYGLIYDSSFYLWIIKNRDKLIKKQSEALSFAVYQSCKIKSDIVKKDEREQKLRMILNFGHTFAHAIESAQNYTGLLHGEAVAVGMIIAMTLSANMGNVDHKKVVELKDLLVFFSLPVSIPSNVDKKTFKQNLLYDKKIKSEKQFFVVLKSIGKALISTIKEKELKKVFTLFF